MPEATLGLATITSWSKRGAVTCNFTDEQLDWLVYIFHILNTHNDPGDDFTMFQKLICSMSRLK